MRDETTVLAQQVEVIQLGCIIALTVHFPVTK